MPTFMRFVRVAIALAMFNGAASTERSGAQCNSASHMTSRPARSASSTCSNDLVKGLGLGLSGASLKFVEHAEFRGHISPCYGRKTDRFGRRLQVPPDGTLFIQQPLARSPRAAVPPLQRCSPTGRCDGTSGRPRRAPE